MTTLLHKLRQNLNPILVSFLFVALFLGIAGALQFPTLSRFLTDNVQTPSLHLWLAKYIQPQQFWVGLFYSVSAIASMVVSFMVALYSDRSHHRKRLILFCCAMALGNTLLFAYNRNYLILISLGILFSSVASCTIPQLFALAREYTDMTGRNAAMFSSIMRAQMSLAWVIGPPVSFLLANQFGFTFMYLAAAMVFLIGGAIIYLFLPNVPRMVTPPIQSNVVTVSFKDKDIIFLFIALVLMWSCNTMYLIDMPIYTDKNLHLGQNLAGYMMGLAAGIEIPFMILAGYLVRFIRKRYLIMIAALSGCVFYLGMSLLNSELSLFLLQFFNAIYIAIIASIGMIYFQDLMPGKVGEATTLFTNSVTMGTIIAGVLQGSIAGSLGHLYIYYISVAIMLIAFVFSCFVRDA